MLDAYSLEKENFNTENIAAQKTNKEIKISFLKITLEKCNVAFLFQIFIVR